MKAVKAEMGDNKEFETGKLRIPLDFPKFTQVEFRAKDSRA